MFYVRRVCFVNVSKFKYILYAQLGFFIFSLAGVMGKFSSGMEFMSAKFMMVYFVQLICFFVFAYIWQQVLKNLNLTVAYVNRGVTLLWSLIWAKVIFNDVITLNNILGVMIIAVGIAIGVGGKDA